MARIDLNCDLGEGAGHDAGLMPLITSANLACGAHAGDETTMRTTLALAWRHGVAVGAHPGFADPENFGRRELPLTPEQIRVSVLEQIRRLQRLATEAGLSLRHVKPHGALYNLGARSRPVADAIADAVRQADPRLVLFGLSGSALLDAGRARGLTVAGEVFADRSYQPDGSLTPRGQPGAMLENAEAAVAQVLRMVREGNVLTLTGAAVPVRADTVCLHGDEPHAVDFARRLRTAFADAGVDVKGFGS